MTDVVRLPYPDNEVVWNDDDVDIRLPKPGPVRALPLRFAFSQWEPEQLGTIGHLFDKGYVRRLRGLRLEISNERMPDLRHQFSFRRKDIAARVRALGRTGKARF
ncbi:MAG TPA: hypothetical protein VFD67_03640 [Gemmatimonadaceae bacterium]|nr:hypothetical protein [Gemmatimonadaceae bacterium]